MLTLEHRSAAAPDPIGVALVSDEAGAHLETRAPDSDEDHLAPPPPSPLAEQVRARLACAAAPLTRTELRAMLRVNNQRLGDALLQLERDGIIERSRGRWVLAASAATSPQLAL